MKSFVDKLKYILIHFKMYFFVIIFFLSIGTASYYLLRNQILKNTQRLGESLTSNYAFEEQIQLAVYETLIKYAMNNIEDNANDEKEIEAEMQNYFDQLINYFGNDVDPYMVLNGKIIAATPWENDSTLDISSCNWYQKALNYKGKVVYTDVYTDLITQKPIVSIALASEKIDSVIVFDIFPDNFDLSMKSDSLPENANFYLCDSNGTIVYDISSSKNGGVEVQNYIYDLIQGIKEGTYDKYDSYIYDIDNIKRNAYYSYLDNGWVAILTIPYKTILAELNEFNLIFAVIIALCLVLTIILFFRDLHLNYKVQRTNDTVKVLGNFYYAIYRVDYKNGTYEMIKGSSYVKNKLKAKGDYEQLLQTCGDVIEKNAYEDFIKTFSLDNIKLLVSQSVKDFGGDFLRLFNGEYRWVNIRLLFDNDLAPSEVILCFKEVDKEKQRELQERKLLEDSLNSAKQSAKAKYTFFNHMSHDMRTPLNAIIGLSELAYKNIDHNDKTAEYLQKIIISSHTLLDLVNDILNMSRIESGKVLLNNHPINLKDCIDNCCSIFKIQAEAQKKHFSLTYDVKSYMVNADAFRINQILNNILSNALKFTKADDKIDVIVEQVEENSLSQYKIIISDTGIGMSKEFIPKMFEPYSRETRFTSNSIAGTGLGMPIVKSLVTQMSGQIFVQSELGKGTTFTIIIPFERVVDDTKSNVSIESCDLGLKGLNILLVEDNEFNMEIAVEMLKMHGSNVCCACNGKEAVDIFSKSNEFALDAILMDMQMPVMDGCEATKRIRSLPRKDSKSIPIIAVTANAFSEDISKTIQAGMNGHISKPIDFNLLCKTLKKYVESNAKDN